MRRCGDHLHLIGCDSNLSGVEYYLFSRDDRERILSGWLELLRDEFDYILIDTPPSLNLLTLNALVAADEVLVPLQAEFFSLEGLTQLRASVEAVRQRWNPELRLGGVVLTQVQARRKLYGEVLSGLSVQFGAVLYETRIRENAAITESSGHAESVMDYAPRSSGAADYQMLADEFVRREEQSR